LQAFADISVFVFLLPHCLAAFDTFAGYDRFRYFYYRSKKHLGALANWSSAAAIW
jgi:hypothetical protein